MAVSVSHDLDLMPPAFAEGLDDGSRGDGTPDSPTWEAAEDARLARGDADFGVCLELRKVGPVARLRYMGELPVLRGAYLEVAARLKAMRGPMPQAQVAAWPGGAGGLGVPGLPETAVPVRLFAYDAVTEIRAVVGPASAPGVDLVWDERVLYAHVGLDLVGPPGGVIRIESIRVRDVTPRFSPAGRVLPGFESSAPV
jgi:hypothetical protein